MHALLHAMEKGCHCTVGVSGTPVQPVCEEGRGGSRAEQRQSGQRCCANCSASGCRAVLALGAGPAGGPSAGTWHHPAVAVGCNQMYGCCVDRTELLHCKQSGIPTTLWTPCLRNMLQPESAFFIRLEGRWNCRSVRCFTIVIPAALGTPHDKPI